MIKKKDRFDLEDSILNVQATVKDLDLFIASIIDGPRTLSEDEIYNLAMGIRSVLDMRSNALWDTFKQVFELDEYNPHGFTRLADTEWTDEDRFWHHQCPEGYYLATPKGMACSFCGATE